jgi:hypothetical protein
LEAEARAEVEAVVWENFWWRGAAGRRRKRMGAAMKIFNAGDERLALR